MALRPTKGMLTGSKETKTLPGESQPFDPNAGTPTSFDNEMPPGDDQRPTEDILTEENVFEMLTPIMVGTQESSGPTSEVLARLQGRGITTQEQLDAAITQIVTDSFDRAQEIVDTMVDNPEELAIHGRPRRTNQVVYRTRRYAVCWCYSYYSYYYGR